MFYISNLPGESAQLLHYLPSIGIPRSALLRRDNVYSRCPIYLTLGYLPGLPCWLSSKESVGSVGEEGDSGSVPASRRPPGGRRGCPLQYSCLENPMDRGAWWSTVHRVTKSCTRLGDLAHVHSGYPSPVELLFKDSLPYLWFFQVMLINFQHRGEYLEWLSRYVRFNTPS